ncbi:MAG: PilZ domain-containing protein [Gammaproteobacteria bacterium]
MQQTETYMAEGGAEWGHRRQQIRHEVCVPCFIKPWAGIRIPCTLIDLSRGGAAIEVDGGVSAPGWQSLQAGTEVTLELEHGVPPVCVSAPVIVARQDARFIGVRFAHDDEAFARTLRQLAAEAVGERTAEFERRVNEIDPARRHTLHECRKAVEDMLANLVWLIRNELANALRVQARNSGRIAAHAAQAEAARLDARGLAIARNIEITVLQGFADVSDLDATQELTLMLVRAADTGQALGTVEVDESDPVAVKREEHVAELARAAQSRYGAIYAGLDARLATVVGHRIDAARNPLLPAALCRICWRAVVDEVDSPRVRTLLFEIMKQQVLPAIGEFYDRLLALLDECESAAAPADVGLPAFFDED